MNGVSFHLSMTNPMTLGDYIREVSEHFIFDIEKGIPEPEFAALKVGTSSVWPYFTVQGDGLQQPHETWSDGVGEIVLQKK